jgi:PAS domain S-box-containing protein
MKEINKKIKVLYVDDEETNLTSFKQLFRRNWDIFIAPSADKGLAILAETQIDVVISDQRMPKVSGSKFLEQVAIEYPDTIRFMLTGYSDFQAIVDAVNYGELDGYLSKPLDATLLKEKIEKGIKVKYLEETNIQLLDEVKESEVKFKGLIENAPDGMLIMNEQMEIELVNKKFEELFEYKRTEILGKTPQMLVPDRFATHMDSVTNFMTSPSSRAMGKGSDLFAKNKNGIEFPVEIALSPLKSKNGLIIIAAIRDITNRKEAEKELEKYRNHLEDLVNKRTKEL